MSGRSRDASRVQTTASGVAIACVLLAVLAGCGAPARRRVAPPRLPTIPERVAQYGPSARARLAPYFAAAGVPYPPQRFALLGFKDERELHLVAAGPGQQLAFVRTYPILGASGGLGPKLRQGDGQVPEGIYRIDYLNPNSVAHLSLGLSYPNDYDLARAAEEGRDTLALGSAIMIHGGVGSAGCLAIGDWQAEELFVLAADAGWVNAVVILSPVDFRRHRLPATTRTVPWAGDLYGRLRAELAPMPAPAPWSAGTGWRPPL